MTLTSSTTRKDQLV